MGTSFVRARGIDQGGGDPPKIARSARMNDPKWAGIQRTKRQRRRAAAAAADADADAGSGAAAAADTHAERAGEGRPVYPDRMTFARLRDRLGWALFSLVAACMSGPNAARDAGEVSVDGEVVLDGATPADTSTADTSTADTSTADTSTADTSSADAAPEAAEDAGPGGIFHRN
jgi:hypothetical protein